MANNCSIDTGLAVFPGEVGNPALHKELVYIYKAFKNIQLGIDRIHRSVAVADSTFQYGDIVNLYDSGGITHARFASAAPTVHPGFGFCSAYAGAVSGTQFEVQYLGILDGLAAITIGAIYYLSDISLGSTITTKPVGAGKIVQPMGIGIATDKVFFNPTLLYTQL